MQPGRFVVVTGLDDLSKKIGKFYKFFSNTINVTETEWTIPYRDNLGLGNRLNVDIINKYGNSLLEIGEAAKDSL